MDKITKVRAIVTIEVIGDEELCEDQIEEVAINSIYVKDKCGLYANCYYQTELKEIEIAYYDI